LIGEIYAILTAVLRGYAVIPIRKGLQYSTPSTSATIYLLINTAILWAITLYNHPLELFLADGFIYFVLAGIIAPGIAARFKDIGISRLGVILSTPIVGTNTFLSMLIAVFLLNEKLTLKLAVGALIIFIGINLLTSQEGNIGRWKKKDLTFPMTAAVLFATSTNLRKLGLLKIGDPLVGATITSTVSLAMLVLTSQISQARGLNSWELKFNREALRYFGLSGLISSIAFLSYFMALSSSSIVKIQPIAGTNPLFAVLFSYIFLKNQEHITTRNLIGTLLVVAGIILITI
jgi:DME family drug/metabolite transporter